MNEENVNWSNSEMNIDTNETETIQMTEETINQSSAGQNIDLNAKVTLKNISDLEVPKKITKLQNLRSASHTHQTLNKEEDEGQENTIMIQSH